MMSNLNDFSKGIDKAIDGDLSAVNMTNMLMSGTNMIANMSKKIADASKNYVSKDDLKNFDTYQDIMNETLPVPNVENLHKGSTASDLMKYQI